MRKHIVAGNWKMNTTVPEGVELAKAVVAKAAEVPSDVKLIIAPPFTHLAPVAEVVKGTAVGLSAQNCADKTKGAYTGEVSVDMLKSVSCEYTILGHSERRQYYGETDAKLVEKIHLALAAGLSPIFCIGENLDEREAGKHFDVVTEQIKNVLYTLTPEEMANVIVAYEPVWAIGTGNTATPQQAQLVHAELRDSVESRDSQAASALRIIYGGSVKPSNAAELFACNDIDGGLVGGASLKAADFYAIAQAASGIGLI